MIQKRRSFAQSPALIVIIRIYWVLLLLVKNPMVAQQQPKSLQCNYLLKHASQPQTVTVNNQLRTKWSSDFVTLRSKAQELHLLHTVSCGKWTGQKRHSLLLSPTIRMIQPVCHVATEILEVLATGGKNLRRSEKTYLEDKLLKNEPVRKTQSAAFKLLENEPVRKDTVCCFHLR